MHMHTSTPPMHPQIHAAGPEWRMHCDAEWPALAPSTAGGRSDYRTVLQVVSLADLPLETIGAGSAGTSGGHTAGANG